MSKCKSQQDSIDYFFLLIFTCQSYKINILSTSAMNESEIMQHNFKQEKWRENKKISGITWVWMNNWSKGTWKNKIQNRNADESRWLWIHLIERWEKNGWFIKTAKIYENICKTCDRCIWICIGEIKTCVW